MEVTGEKAAKPLTAVQHCISTFVIVTPFRSFNESSGQFFSVFLETVVFVCEQNRYLKPKHLFS